MALLKEDNSFTHVIAIDFGTGASGYFLSNVDMRSRQEILIKMERYVSKYSVHVMAVMTKRHPLLFYLITMEILLILAQMLFKNTPRLSKMGTQLCFSKMYLLCNLV